MPRSGHAGGRECREGLFRQEGLFPSLLYAPYDAGFGTWYLEDWVGRKRAREVRYLKSKYSAREAQALGLVNEVAPHALRARTEAICEELKERGPHDAALALGPPVAFLP